MFIVQILFSLEAKVHHFGEIIWLSWQKLDGKNDATNVCLLNMKLEAVAA